MVHARLLVLVALVAGLSLFACSGTTGEAPITDAGLPPQADAGVTLTKAELRSDVRDAFIAELQWSRLYAVSALAGGADASAAFSQLMQAEDSLASQATELYGPAEESALASLLHTRAQAFASFVAQLGGRSAVSQFFGKDALYANAADIARFFTALDPNAWVDLETKLRAQIDANLDGIIARAQGDDIASVKAFGTAQDSTLVLADSVSAGLAQVFSAELLPPTTTPENDELMLRLRVAMDDHAFWLRAWMVDHLANLTAADELNRAVASSYEVASVFASLYGTGVAGSFQLAFHDDTADAVAYVFASQTGNPTTIMGITRQWNADANKLAQLLVVTLRSTDSAGIQSATSANVAHQRAMIEARFARSWDTDASSFDLVVTNLGTLGDTVGVALAQPAIN